jgi:hypothetical protein
MRRLLLRVVCVFALGWGVFWISGLGSRDGSCTLAALRLGTCRRGDWMAVSSADATKYCDFDRRVVHTSGGMLCQYVGYTRQGRQAPTPEPYREKTPAELNAFMDKMLGA